MSVVILQNDPKVPAGYLLLVLKAKNIPFAIHDAQKGVFPEVGGALAVVALGGHQGAYETDKYPFLQQEIDYLRAATQAGVPVLGICLGCQLLAVAMGGKGYKAGHSEIGYSARFPMSLVSSSALSQQPFLSTLLQASTSSESLSLSEHLLCFHSDTFDLAPDTCTVLARSDRCIQVCGSASLDAQRLCVASLDEHRLYVASLVRINVWTKVTHSLAHDHGRSHD
jgi:GMP synthase-like glutamine amidotransferase